MQVLAANGDVANCISSGTAQHCLLCCVPVEPGSVLGSRRWSSFSQASFGHICTCPAAVPLAEALVLLSIHSVLGEQLQLYIQ